MRASCWRRVPPCWLNPRLRWRRRPRVRRLLHTADEAYEKAEAIRPTLLGHIVKKADRRDIAAEYYFDPDRFRTMPPGDAPREGMDIETSRRNA